ncbi:MAG: hypothetical protein KDN19_00185 [Verrucomicrobiae bacterium]|nr:hypothetical protein [Verrucomicrobiae bacterium]
MNGAEFPFPILIFGLVAVVVVVVIILTHLQEKKRREELGALAERFGLRFSPGKYRKFDHRYPAFQFLGTGSNRYAENVIHGKVGEFAIEAFDYHYETHSTDGKGNTQTHHHRFTVVAFETPFPLANMTVRPEGIFDKISAAFGWDDIDFESAEFSRRFHVSSSDRRWAYDVLHARTIDLLLNSPRLPLYFSGRNLLIKGDHRFSASEYPRIFEVGRRVLEGIPEFARGA